MTTTEKIARVQEYLMNDPTATAEIVQVYVEDAKEEILKRLYSIFGAVPEGVSDVPAIYEGVQCQLAASRFAKRGGIGQTVHIENGVHRHWETSDDRQLLNEVIPYAKVM